MNQNEFMRQQQAAVERMREMNARAQIGNDTTHKMLPVPSFVRVNENNRYQNQAPQNNNTHISESRQNGSAPLPQNRSVTKRQPQGNSFLSDLNIPFLDNLLKDGDSTLIIGLLLILMSENTDRILLFALIYILL